MVIRDQIGTDLRALETAIFRHDVRRDWDVMKAPPIILTGWQGEIQIMRPEEITKNQDKYDLIRDFARMRARDKAKMLELIRENRRLRGQDQFMIKQKPVCHNCNRMGHYVRSCRKKRRKQKSE